MQKASAELFDAVGRNDLPKINELLTVDDKEFVNAARTDGTTVVHLACAEGNRPLLELLHKNSADLNAKKNNGETPTHIAAAAGHIECLQFLIENNHISQFDKPKTENGKDTPARLALDNDHFTCLRHLLEANIDTGNVAQTLNSKLEAASELIRDNLKFYPEQLKTALNNLRMQLNRDYIPSANSKNDLIKKTKILGILHETNKLLVNLEDGFKLIEADTSFIEQYTQNAKQHIASDTMRNLVYTVAACVLSALILSAIAAGIAVAASGTALTASLYAATELLKTQNALIGAAIGATIGAVATALTCYALLFKTNRCIDNLGTAVKNYHKESQTLTFETL